jgi:hypothetical protein
MNSNLIINKEDEKFNEIIDLNNNINYEEKVENLNNLDNIDNLDDEIIDLNNKVNDLGKEINDLEKEFENMLNSKLSKLTNKKNIYIEETPIIKEDTKPKRENREYREIREYRRRPMVKNNLTGRFDLTFASASITFTHNKLGQLHCKEYRWVDKFECDRTVYHLIGGKVEESDYDILYTGVREFVEETNIFMDDSLVSNNDIKKLSDKIYYEIKNKIKYYDLVVNSRTNLLHRCFIFNINKFTDINIRNKIMGLPRFYSKLLKPDIRIIKELDSLKWLVDNDKEKISEDDLSPLIKDYYSNINNFV